MKALHTYLSLCFVYINDPQKYWHFSLCILEGNNLKQNVKFLQNIKDVEYLSHFKNHGCLTPRLVLNLNKRFRGIRNLRWLWHTPIVWKLPDVCKLERTNMKYYRLNITVTMKMNSSSVKLDAPFPWLLKMCEFIYLFLSPLQKLMKGEYNLEKYWSLQGICLMKKW